MSSTREQFSFSIGESAYAEGYKLIDDDTGDMVGVPDIYISGSGELELNSDWFDHWNKYTGSVFTVPNGITSIPDRFFQRTYQGDIEAASGIDHGMGIYNRVHKIIVGFNVRYIGAYAFSNYWYYGDGKFAPIALNCNKKFHDYMAQAFAPRVPPLSESFPDVPAPGDKLDTITEEIGLQLDGLYRGKIISGYHYYYEEGSYTPKVIDEGRLSGFWKYIDLNHIIDIPQKYSALAQMFHLNSDNEVLAYVTSGDCLTEVEFRNPNIIRTLGFGAFSNCNSLKRVNFNNHSPDYHGDGVFANCFELEQVDFGDNYYMHTNDFKNCFSLKNFSKKNKICGIEGGAPAQNTIDTFKNCIHMEYITMEHDFLPESTWDYGDFFENSLFSIDSNLYSDTLERDEYNNWSLKIYGDSAYPCCRRWIELDKRNVTYKVNDWQYTGRLVVLLSHSGSVIFYNLYPRPIEEEKDQFVPLCVHRNRIWYIRSTDAIPEQLVNIAIDKDGDKGFKVGWDEAAYRNGLLGDPRIQDG